MSGHTRDACGSGLSAATDSAPPRRTLSVRDAARLLTFHEQTIRRAIDRGDLSATKHAGVFQIEPAALDRFKLLESTSREDCSRPNHGATRPLALLPRPEIKRPQRFPVPLTPLFGRQSQLAEIATLLTRRDVRLVRLTGPGGVGETRLALAAAQESAGDFQDGE